MSQVKRGLAPSPYSVRFQVMLLLMPDILDRQSSISRSPIHYFYDDKMSIDLLRVGRYLLDIWRRKLDIYPRALAVNSYLGGFFEGRRMKRKLFEFVVLFHEEVGTKEKQETVSKIIVNKQMVLATDLSNATMLAARAIPEEYTEHLDRCEVAVRPF